MCRPIEGLTQATKPPYPLPVTQDLLDWHKSLLTPTTDAKHFRGAWLFCLLAYLKNHTNQVL